MVFSKRMADKKSQIITVLTPVSFVISLVSLILVISDAEDFTQNNIKKRNIPHIKYDINESGSIMENSPNDSATDSYINKPTPINNAITITTEGSKSVTPPTKSPDIDDIINDLEVVNIKNNFGGSNKSAIQARQEKAPTGKQKTTIIFQKHASKDDAILELNRLRVKHRDITSKIETVVKKIKSNNEEEYAIVGIVNGDRAFAQDICDKFEVRNVQCVVN